MPHVTRIGTLVAKAVGVLFSVAGGKVNGWLEISQGRCEHDYMVAMLHKLT